MVDWADRTDRVGLEIGRASCDETTFGGVQGC